MSQGNGHIGGNSSCLKGCMYQWLPQYWLSTEPSSCARGQTPNTTSHVSVMLHQVLLHDATTTAAWTWLRALPLQYGILLADAAQPIHGHGLKGPAHHGELLEHSVEMVHTE